jgi:hypothetical protein
MQHVTTRFDQAAAWVKQELFKARQRGMEQNSAFFSWGGTMDSQTYLRFTLLLTIGTILASLLLYGLVFQFFLPSVSVFDIFQSASRAADFVSPSLLGMGLSWLVGMFHSLLQIGISLVVSVLLASLVDRRLRDVRRTQEWHFEIMAAGFALSLLPVLSWMTYLAALALAFVHTDATAAASPMKVTSCPPAEHQSTPQQPN